MAVKKQDTSVLDATAFRRLLKNGQAVGGFLFVGEEQYTLCDTVLPS